MEKILLCRAEPQPKLKASYIIRFEGISAKKFDIQTFEYALWKREHHQELRLERLTMKIWTLHQGIRLKLILG